MVSEVLGLWLGEDWPFGVHRVEKRDAFSSFVLDFRVWPETVSFKLDVSVLTLG